MEENNWQQRTELLLGEEKMKRIRASHVLVVGLGGVGAYAAEMLCRVTLLFGLRIIFGCCGKVAIHPTLSHMS